MLVYQKIPIEKSRPFFSGYPHVTLFISLVFSSRDVTELMDLAQRADSTLRPRVDRRWGGLRRFFSWVENLVTTWVFPKMVVLQKWMVKIMENPIKMDDLGGKPTIFGNTHMCIRFESGVNFKMAIRLFKQKMGCRGRGHRRDLHCWNVR